MTPQRTPDPVLKHLIPLLVGAGVTILGLSLSLGPMNALALLGLSILCTAGLGLVFWLPLFLGVGWLIILVVNLFRHRERLPTSQDAVQQQTLIAYIGQSLKANASESQIVSRLKLQGWDEAEIEQAWIAVQRREGDG